jgi:hypothetical protein
VRAHRRATEERWEKGEITALEGRSLTWAGHRFLEEQGAEAGSMPWDDS